ncbi:MAG: hypothetical protein EPO11_11110, partial [Gammaproteobacteria bacterium]
MTKNFFNETTIDFSLKNDFKKTFPPYLIYLATIIISLSYFKDMARVGFNPYWLAIRLCYLPFMLIIWQITKNKLNRFYEIPLWASGLYITLLCSYFSFATSGIKSDYIFGLIQFYFAIAVMPVTAASFYILYLMSLFIYVGLSLLSPGSGSFIEHATAST